MLKLKNLGVKGDIMKLNKIIFLFFFLLTIISCGGSSVGTSASNPSSTAFPQGLVVASPVELESSTSSSTLIKGLTKSGLSSVQSTASEVAAEEINAILDGDEIGDCDWDPTPLLDLPDDATCYGTRVLYENHPDYNASDPGNTKDGQLPPGDVGIWTETTPEGEACAPAEINARMQGIKGKTTTALKAFASMLCVANVNNVTLSTNGDVDLTDEMNATIENVSFESATLIHDNSSGEDVYSYDLVFSFENNTETHEATLSMTHTPGETPDTLFSGYFSYTVNATMDMGNCPAEEVTYAGSVDYDRDEPSMIKFRADDSIYCDHDAQAVQESGLLNPADTYDATSNPDGWGNNFTTIIGNQSVDGTGGTYTMSWQAGFGDDHSRTFNFDVDKNSETNLLTGTAYFGFGAQVQSDSYDGSIEGMICNWAGPGQGEDIHDPVGFVQFQEIEESEGGILVSTVSNIQYSPTQDCEYNGGDFRYDQDGDETIEQEEITDIGNGIANELLPIDEMSFTLPVMP